MADELQSYRSARQNVLCYYVYYAYYRFLKMTFHAACNTVNKNILQSFKSESAPCLKLLSLKRKSQLWSIERSRF